MTFLPPHLDEPAARDAWQEVETALEELTRLARSDIRPSDLHSELLQRLVRLSGAAAGVVWAARTDEFFAECQINLGHALASDKEELARHCRMAEHVAARGQTKTVPPAYRDAEFANASPWLAMLCPISTENHTAGNNAVAVVELFQQPDAHPAIVEGHLRLLQTACEIAAEYHKSRKLRELHQRQGEVAGLVDYVQRIHRSLELPATAATIANEARHVIGCDRVSVVDLSRRWPRVAAISGVESFDRKSGVVQAVEMLAAALRHAGQPVWFPDEVEDQSPQVVDAFQRLVDETHAAATGVVPLVTETDAEQPGIGALPTGALIVESITTPLDRDQMKKAAVLARASAAALQNAIQYDRIPLRRVLQRLASLLGIAPAQRWSPALTAIAGVVAAVLLLVFIPADFSIEARGQLMPQRRQHVFAPSDGIVMDLARRDGDVVRKEELLARLHSPALDISESELIGKLRTVQEELIAAETATLRSDAEATREPRAALTSRALTLKEELRGVESQLAIVRQQQAELSVRSPLSGTVITWDVERQLAGRPVKRGDLLLTVADTQGPWELLLDLADHRAGHVIMARRQNENLPVTFQLGTNPGDVGRGTLAALSPATDLSAEMQPTVRAIVELSSHHSIRQQAARYRPGASVVARIRCGRRSLGYVWLHELWEAIRMRLFV